MTWLAVFFVLTFTRKSREERMESIRTKAREVTETLNDERFNRFLRRDERRRHSGRRIQSQLVTLENYLTSDRLWLAEYTFRKRVRRPFNRLVKMANRG